MDTTLFAHCSSRRAGLRLKIFYFVWCGSLIPLTKVIVHVQWEFYGTLNFTSELVLCSVINFLVQYFRSLKCYDKKCIFCIEFFIDSAGFVHSLGRDLTITSFQAYEIRVSHFYQLKQQNFLFTVGVSFLTYGSIWHLCIKSNQVFFNFDKLYKSKWQMCTNLLLGNYLTHTHTHSYITWTAATMDSCFTLCFQANFKLKYLAGTCTCTPTMKYTSSPPQKNQQQ